MKPLARSSLLLSWALAAAPARAAQVSVSGDGLTARFGVEPAEAPAPGSWPKTPYESWELTCGAERRKPWCLLETYKILDFGPDEDCRLSGSRHDSRGGGLRVERLKLEEGRLDFSLRLADGSRMEVRLRFDGEDGAGGRRLVDFSAVRRGHDPGKPEERLEYRVPERSREVRPACRFVLGGRKSLDESRLESFTETLSAPDRSAFAANGSGYSRCVEERLAALALEVRPDLQSPEFYRKVVIACAPSFRLSPAGEAKFKEYVLGAFQEMGSPFER